MARDFERLLIVADFDANEIRQERVDAGEVNVIARCWRRREIERDKQVAEPMHIIESEALIAELSVRQALSRCIARSQCAVSASHAGSCSQSTQKLQTYLEAVWRCNLLPFLRCPIQSSNAALHLRQVRIGVRGRRVKLFEPGVAVGEGFADNDILLGAQTNDVCFEFVGQRAELSAWLRCIVGLLHGGLVRLFADVERPDSRKSCLRTRKRGPCKFACTASEWDLIACNSSQRCQRGEQGVW